MGAPLSRTTVMMRNIPNTLTREMLLDTINTEGFVDCYDFVYLPMDFKSMVALGYSFVNFVDSEDAERFKTHFSGFSNWGHESDKVCERVAFPKPSKQIRAPKPSILGLGRPGPDSS